ncbi:hypothetical protein NDU88_003168 [Pleurodeles waltl]|uniref:Uncharacterized protein n=1 Tax=Pleurodeles waltl TaxID=8319 RepID=A0AAV7MXQ6_PLEWA|nr:hypothetical protein NDU88_003168 [Pleurodeles waltl]
MIGCGDQSEQTVDGARDARGQRPLWGSVGVGHQRRPGRARAAASVGPRGTGSQTQSTSASQPLLRAFFEVRRAVARIGPQMNGTRGEERMERTATRRELPPWPREDLVTPGGPVTALRAAAGGTSPPFPPAEVARRREKQRNSGRGRLVGLIGPQSGVENGDRPQPREDLVTPGGPVRALKATAGGTGAPPPPCRGGEGVARRLEKKRNSGRGRPAGLIGPRIGVENGERPQSIATPAPIPEGPESNESCWVSRETRY